MTSHSTAEVHVETRAEQDTLIGRATDAGLNVDSRKVSMAVARPYIVVIHGAHGDDMSLPDLWADMPTAEVESHTEDDDA